MFAEIISIGDEILIGQIANTNAAWMAQQLNMIGIPVRQLTTVGDNKKDILKSFSSAKQRADIILITGGLGPTNDDITKSVLCDFFHAKLIFNSKCFENVKHQFQIRGTIMLPENIHQAEVLENCTPIHNMHGTAPGMWIGIFKNKIFVALPGVPYEMKAMMQDFIIPELKKRFHSQVILHKTILTQGTGETFIAKKIKHWENSLAAHGIKLAYLPSPGIVKLRLSVLGTDEIKLSETINKKIEELIPLLGDYFFGIEEYGKEPLTIEKIICKMLNDRKQTLAVAESCTGGYIGHLITSIPGSSDYFKGGIIAYSNEIKTSILGVDKNTLMAKGVVSKEVAELMATGVRKKMHSDFGIATTGIAGPTGGTSKKPIGTVWIAVSSSEKIIAEKFNFGNDRERNIRKTALAAFSMLRKLLVNSYIPNESESL
ncbi:MAG: competence/damage-inducible protein A [Bacteroidota bacterium]